MMLDKIAMLLRSECRLEVSSLWVVGVSGGPDSLCLLHVLHRLGSNVLAVHVNHQLRPEAGGEAQIVKAFAHGLGVSFISSLVDVYSYAQEHSISIEEAARLLRYKVLFEQAKRKGAEAVLVAHNADDQVETILMHLLRGSGLVGLRGMEYRKLPNPWSETIPLVRPLISTWREEILGYLEENQVDYVTDQSNLDTTFFRNRLRHELLPYLEKYNPRIRQNLLRMSLINKADYAVIDQLVSEAWNANLEKLEPGYVAFNLPGFQKLPAAIQRYLLRRAISYHLPSLRDIDFESIQRGIRFLGDDQMRGQVDLIANLRLIKEGRIFWLTGWQMDLPSSDYPFIGRDQVITLDIPSTQQLINGWQLQAVLEDNPEQAIMKSGENKDSFEAWVTLDSLASPLYIRTRRSGERFQPLGMQGHSLKVSDLMVNLKMPRRVRPTWPLICSGENILWIPGYRQGYLGRLFPGSRQIVHLSLRRIGST